MARLTDAQDFACQVAGVNHLRDLVNLVEAITRDIGFRRFALVQHVNAPEQLPGAIKFCNYPPLWSEHFETNFLYDQDPVVRASDQSMLGFSWTDLPRFGAWTNDTQDLMRAAEREGVGNGYTVPLPEVNGLKGSFNFATPEREMDDSDRMLAFIIARLAFETATRIADRSTGPNESQLLTDRQRDCVVLAARGKTDWEISRVLGIGEETVTQHLKAARNRYGVERKTLLAIKALHAGEISFSDIFG